MQCHTKERAVRLIPPDLDNDLAVLQKRGFRTSVTECDAKIYVVFSDFPMPKGTYNMDVADVMVFTTPYYPQAGFDMFWTDRSLTLRDGRIPAGGEVEESHLGRVWRRFSYHPYGDRVWNPSRDNIAGFVAYVQQRLQRGD